MGDKSYKFKPSNWNLETYLSTRQHLSRALRDDAAMKRLQADTIDDELSELQKSLEEIQ